MRPFHENINQRRIELGLTYEQVRQALELRKWPEGVSAPSVATVGHWFNGTRRPRHMEHLRALCETLQMTLDEAAGSDALLTQTTTEQAALEAFRGLSPAQQQAFLAAMSASRQA